MEKLTEKLIDEVIQKFNKQKYDEQVKINCENELQSVINPCYENKAVLGFDIYRYSQYPNLQQTLIPYIFKSLYSQTIDNCIKYEECFFFGKEKIDFEKDFIDNGDGGFQIFETPMHAIIFATYFQSNIQRFNTSIGDNKIISLIIGEITLRYSLTYDLTYSYDGKFYGTAIINNSRIMAKDNLNRFLIDSNSFDWFRKIVNGIENLQIISYSDLVNTNISNINKNKKSLIFNESKTNRDETAHIMKVDILKIGDIKSKLNIISIYSLHLQVLMISENYCVIPRYTITIGNLNSTGISEDKSNL